MRTCTCCTDSTSQDQARATWAVRQQYYLMQDARFGKWQQAEVVLGTLSQQGQLLPSGDGAATASDDGGLLMVLAGMHYLPRPGVHYLNSRCTFAVAFPFHHPWGLDKAKTIPHYLTPLQQGQLWSIARTDNYKCTELAVHWEIAGLVWAVFEPKQHCKILIKKGCIS